MMAGITSKDTRPELVVRKSLWHEGIRYRLHRKNMPGRPDLVLPKHKAVIFIHGCFWHQHDCHLFKWPSTRPDFWKTKLERNVIRDCKVQDELLNQGWRCLIIWECSLKGKNKLPRDEMVKRVIEWLHSDNNKMTIRGRNAELSK